MPSSQALRVLVADDDPLQLRLAARVLRSLGHTGALVTHGRMALDLLGRQAFDLLLLDLRMPEMDGFDVIDALRSRSDGLKDIPIIVVTADASPGLEDDCLAAGADAVLFKPIAMQSLFDSIAELVVDRSDPDKPLG